MTLSVFAPAKVNLSLAVGRPLLDGRHPLMSLAAFATVGDTLRLEPADRLTLRVIGPFAASLEAEADNLVVRAARALSAAAGRQQRGATLTLEKNLPVASGIGGGSADAAAALRGLNALWGLGFDAESLAEVATTLGADVPVCVRCVPALMQGTGETVTAFAMPRLDAVLVNPGVPAATGAVYKQFDALALGEGFEPGAVPPQWETASQALRALAGLGNDLTAPAMAVAPAIADVMERLRHDPRAQIVRLSGSGATVFALAEGAAAAQAIAQDLAAEARGWWVAPAQLGAVDAHPRAV
jgi:4-diphosphocytidyl-2-C-methyl-D-erythritol kinase